MECISEDVDLLCLSDNAMWSVLRHVTIHPLGIFFSTIILFSIIYSSASKWPRLLHYYDRNHYEYFRLILNNNIEWSHIKYYPVENNVFKLRERMHYHNYHPSPCNMDKYSAHLSQFEKKHVIKISLNIITL